SWGMMGMLASQ
nr:Chain A, TAR DNA-binding protein 43 [Homo sapiens]6CFH_B Chain B, TAR DNA-binding protein 43 [Homo sapiens]